ncbi:hypothetical protein [Rhodococcus koreensis]
MSTPPSLDELLTPLVDAGVDAIHASTRRYWLPEFDGSALNLAGWVKKLTGLPTISVGSVGLDKEYVSGQGRHKTAGIESIDLLLDRLEADEFDLVAVGRALLADHEWAAKAITGRLDDSRPYDAEVLEQLH